MNSILFTYPAWLIHLILLALIIKLYKNETYEIKLILFIYLFYSIAPLFNYEMDIFNFYYENEISAEQLITYAITDILIITSILATKKTNRINIYNNTNTTPILLGIIIFSYINGIIQNIEIYTTHETKGELISTEKIPNLFVYELPSDLLIAGLLYASLASSEKSRIMHAFLLACFLITLIISFGLGYRYLLFISLMYFLIKRKTSLIMLLLLVSFSGQLSSYINGVFVYYTKNDADISIFTFIEHYIDNLNIGITGEQKVIAANFQLGLEVINISISEALQPLLKILPLSSLLINSQAPQLTEGIGNLVSTGTGEGVAYNFQLYLLQTMGISGIFLVTIIYLARKTTQTLLFPLVAYIFFSILRNTPEYWLSQVKQLFILLSLLVLLNLYKRHFRKK